MSKIPGNTPPSSPTLKRSRDEIVDSSKKARVTHEIQMEDREEKKEITKRPAEALSEASKKDGCYSDMTVLPPRKYSYLLLDDEHKITSKFLFHMLASKDEKAFLKQMMINFTRSGVQKDIRNILIDLHLESLDLFNKFDFDHGQIFDLQKERIAVKKLFDITTKVKPYKNPKAMKAFCVQFGLSLEEAKKCIRDDKSIFLKESQLKTIIYNILKDLKCLPSSVGKKLRLMIASLKPVRVLSQ